MLRVVEVEPQLHIVGSLNPWQYIKFWEHVLYLSRVIHRVMRTHVPCSRGLKDDKNAAAVVKHLSDNNLTSYI